MSVHTATTAIPDEWVQQIEKEPDTFYISQEKLAALQSFIIAYYGSKSIRAMARATNMKPGFIKSQIDKLKSEHKIV